VYSYVFENMKSVFNKYDIFIFIVCLI